MNTSDVKELTPEFFYLPGFLTNADGFCLGTRQVGQRGSAAMHPRCTYMIPALLAEHNFAASTMCTPMRSKCLQPQANNYPANGKHAQQRIEVTAQESVALFVPDHVQVYQGPRSSRSLARGVPSGLIACMTDQCLWVGEPPGGAFPAFSGAVDGCRMAETCTMWSCRRGQRAARMSLCGCSARRWSATTSRSIFTNGSTSSSATSSAAAPPRPPPMCSTTSPTKALWN